MRTNRYIISIIHTISILYTYRPKTIVSQNPSIILSFLVIILKRLFSYNLIIDAHNSGIFPAEGHNPHLMKLAKFIQKYSDLTIVTNEKLQDIVQNNQGRAFILQDKIPEVAKISSIPLAGKKNVACICTYGEDEPYLEIIKAVKLLPNDIFIYLTGNYRNKVDINNLPSNLILSGYLSEDDYWCLLKSADLVMDLTLREDCLVCGAYEGIAVLKPMVLSNTKALMSYFDKGCTYVSPDCISIAKGIKDAFVMYKQLKNEIIVLKTVLEKDWRQRIFILQSLINKLESTSSKKLFFL